MIKNSNINIFEHFADVGKMIKISKGAEKVCVVAIHIRLSLNNIRPSMFIHFLRKSNIIYIKTKKVKGGSKMSKYIIKGRK